MPSDLRVPKFLAMRSQHRGQTLIEVLAALVVLSVIIVFVSGDLTSIANVNKAAGRSDELAAANFLLGVMKSDPNFWNGGTPGSNDWATGPSDVCYAPLGPYTDPGPSPSPDWHTPPPAPGGCPNMPFTDQGGFQNQVGPPVGNVIQYMWSASYHQGDFAAADLTVWVRRDVNAPAFAFHGIRYEYPNATAPSPIPSGSPTPGPSPKPSITPSPQPSQSIPPTPSPKPTSVGV